MCGIVAVIGTKTLGIQENNVFKDMLVMDQLRGKDSVGVFGVSAKGVSLNKSISHPSDFLQLKKTTDIISSAMVLVGHNRHATLGAVNSNNAHPFQHGAITLVHNGTLDRYPALPNQAEFDTDSECVAYNLSSKDTFQEVITFLESVSGAFTFVWYDTDANATFYVRNDERPLYQCQLGDTLYLSSERGILMAALDRRNVQFKLAQIKEVPVGVLHVAGMNNKGKMEIDKTPITLRKKVVVSTTSYWDGHGRTNYNRYPSTNTYQTPAVVRNALELELGLLSGTWHKAVVSEVIHYSGRNFGNVTCRLVDPEFMCSVIAYNQDLAAGYGIGEVIEVQLQSLDMELHGNKHAKDNASLTIRGSGVRKVEETPHVCVNCEGLYLQSEGKMMNSGEFVCDSCYLSDDTIKLYVDSNRVA